MTCNRTKETSHGIATCSRKDPHVDSGSDHIAELWIDGEKSLVTWCDRFPDAVQVRMPAWRADR